MAKCLLCEGELTAAPFVHGGLHTGCSESVLPHYRELEHKRQRFEAAKAALTGLVDSSYAYVAEPEHVARKAVGLADALLTELAKPKGES